MNIRMNGHIGSPVGRMRFYSPDLLSRIQDLLAQMADLDCALKKGLEDAKGASCPESTKLERLRHLEEHYQKQHKVIADELSALESRVRQELQL